jgi:hypothetical protein
VQFWHWRATRNAVQQSFYLRKIGTDQQPGFLAFGIMSRAELRAAIGLILPDDMVNRRLVLFQTSGTLVG